MTKTKKSKVTVRSTNPNGANQFILDPRQEIFWGFYVNPKSDTFSNALQSAIKAGYPRSSAGHITAQPWFVEKMRRFTLLQKAEKVLEETIEMQTFQPVIGPFGPIMISTGEVDENGKPKKEMLYGENDKLLKIKQDTAKFVAERLGKNKGYSTRQELTGADGKDLPTPIFGGSSQ